MYTYHLLFVFSCIDITLSLKLSKQQLYVFSTNKWSDDILQAPSIGNGNVGMVVKANWMHMNGIYNGKNTSSHRASIPSTNNIKLISFCSSKKPSHCSRHFKWQKDRSSKSYSLDTRTGVFTERHMKDNTYVKMQWFVHRTLAPLIVFKLSVGVGTEGRGSMGSIKFVSVLLNVKENMISKDVQFTELPCPFQNARCMKGETNEAENDGISQKRSFYLIFDRIPSNNRFHFGSQNKDPQEIFYLTSLHYNKHTAFSAFETGKEWVKSKEIEKRNARGWKDVWMRGRLELEGDLQVARSAVASLYGMYISLPFKTFSSHNEYEEKLNDEFIGLSPSGLSWGDTKSYQGHVFWDQEVWMEAPLLLFNHHIAKSLLKTRLRTLSIAYHNAHLASLRGTKFPWESAYTGLEAGPYEPCNLNEIHINGDISLAFRTFFHVTAFNFTTSVDEFVGARTSNLLIGIGDYWLSRITYNQNKDRYEIYCVMPPDEYEECVSNSAYTNSICIISLQMAALAAASVGFKNASVYNEIAMKVYVPFDSNLLYHPEYDNFKTDKMVKQADVILLNFPLLSNNNATVIHNDLSLYQPLTDTQGPAMSDSMFVVGWLSVAEEKKAATSFFKMLQHVNGDFQVWTESKNGKGAPNFITGMGGYLQAILFGYAGIRISENHLTINPTLPPNITTLSIYHINYHGCLFDVVINKTNITIKMTIENNPKSLFQRKASTIGNKSFPNKKSNTKGILNDVTKVKVVYIYEKGTTELHENKKVVLERRIGHIYVKWF